MRMPSGSRSRAVCSLLVLLPVLGGAVLGWSEASALASPPPAPTSQAATPAERVEQAVGAYEAGSKAVVGVSMVDLRTGQILAGIRADEPRIPASNQKVLTSAFALSRLGADFRFRTRVFLAGSAIVVVGDFDPTLGDPVLAAQDSTSIYVELDKWAAAIAKAFGGSPVTDLLVVSPGSPAVFRHPDWPKDQYDRWYCAPVAALNLHNNCLDISFQADKTAVTPTVMPESRFIRVTNGVKVGAKAVWSCRLSQDDSAVTLSGTVPTGKTYPLSVPVNDPPILLGRVLADRMALAGVPLTGRVRRADSVPGVAMVPICETITPLAVAMERANKRSLNMAAEGIFLRAGDGTWAGSAAMMAEELRRSAGLRDGEFTVADGSGMSRRNRLTPSAATRVLWSIARHKDAATFVASLPVAGEDGTLKSRMDQKGMRGRVVAKTGYLLGASALSGYVLDEHDGPIAAFSILANSVPAGKAWQAKQLQDSLCRILVDAVVAK